MSWLGKAKVWGWPPVCDEDYGGFWVEVSGADLGDWGGHRFAGVVWVAGDGFGFGDEVVGCVGGFGGDAVFGAGVSGQGVDVAGFECGVEVE